MEHVSPYHVSRMKYIDLCVTDVNFFRNLRLVIITRQSYADPARDSLKEDASVDTASITITSSQIFFTWGLTSLLVAWMIIFAVLALRPEKPKKTEPEELSVAYSSVSAPSSAPPSLVHAEV
jgi:hypothetical protein